MPSNGPTSTFPRRRISRSTIIARENHVISHRSTTVMQPMNYLICAKAVFTAKSPSPHPSPRKRGEGEQLQPAKPMRQDFHVTEAAFPLPACGERDRVRG